MRSNFNLRGAVACIHGHAFDEANTYVREDGTRACRACVRRRSYERWLRKSGKAA